MSEAKPKAVLSWSSGKDCAMALHRCRTEGLADVVALLTSVSSLYDRVSINGTRRDLLRAQARAVGLPLIEVNLPSPCSNEEYEAAMAAATDEIKAMGINTMVFGDLFLQDIRAYREANLARAGMTGLFPLWNEPTGALAEKLLDLGFKTRIVSVMTKALAPGFAGRDFDRAFLADLPKGIDPCGENGEFHSFVWDGPIFSAPVAHHMGERVERDGMAYVDLIADEPGSSAP